MESSWIGQSEKILPKVPNPVRQKKSQGRWKSKVFNLQMYNLQEKYFETSFIVALKKSAIGPFLTDYNFEMKTCNERSKMFL